MENKIRGTLNEIYFGKTRDIVNDLRFVNSDHTTVQITKYLQFNVVQ